MATKSFFVSLVLSLFLASCQTSPFEMRSEEKKQTKAHSDQQDLEPIQQPPKHIDTYDKDKPFRPKIGLVLGPGLAHSFAHIGLLKELLREDIPIEVVVGMGWSSIVAKEFATQGSLHGLEWKASRSENLKNLSNLGFWKKTFAEKEVQDVKVIMNELLSDSKPNSEHSTFACPIYSLKNQKVAFVKDKGFEICAAVPPLFNPGLNYSPYIMGSKDALEAALNLGAEKIIYINVLEDSSLWGENKTYLTGASYWYWTLVKHKLKEDQDSYDKVVSIRSLKTDLLDFNNILNDVRAGELSGKKLVKFLKAEYQY